MGFVHTVKFKGYLVNKNIGTSAGAYLLSPVLRLFPPHRIFRRDTVHARRLEVGVIILDNSHVNNETDTSTNLVRRLRIPAGDFLRASD